jgi:putative NADPH-quinone reductase
MTNKKVLILYAHPTQHRSEVNQPMFLAAETVAGVTAVDLYREYPTFNIQIAREQQRLLEHDVIIFQFPLFWYSTPAILKEWQDLVLEYGFAYGREGTALNGKLFLAALSAGGTADAYHDKGYNHFTIRELLQPLEQMATATGMSYVAPFTLFGSRTAVDEDRMAAHIASWRQLLSALVEDRFDAQLAGQLETLNPHLAEIIGESV